MRNPPSWRAPRKRIAWHVTNIIGTVVCDLAERALRSHS